ncbi:MAG: hypothetical protein ACFFB0_21215 [Promethearchaeota archaeon]
MSKRIIDFSLSWILIFNFAWLTFNTFNIVPDRFLLALSLAITTFGLSFFIFNRYKMKISVTKIIPYSVITIGASLSATSFVSIVFKASPGYLITTFSLVFILFFYVLIAEYRYFLWFILPIPLTSPILESLLRFDIIQPFWFLTYMTLYLITFQVLINLFKKSVKKDPLEISNSFFNIFKDENQLKWFNFICLLLNSICISLFIGIIIPNLIEHLLFTQILLVYQLCDFLLIWSFLFLFSMKYLEKLKLEVKIKDLLLHFNKISLILYIIIPLTSGINLILYLFLINKEIIISIYSFLILASGIAVIEGFILDRGYFYFLFNSIRNRFTLWSWLIFCNITALFFYLGHSNVFLLLLTISLLNLISVYFLSYLDISKTKISITRLTLIYNSFIWSSFYFASLISDLILFIFKDLSGFLYFSLIFQNSFLFLYILSYFLLKIDKTFKNWIEFVLFITFQILLAVNLYLILVIFTPLNFFTVNIVIFIELCLSFNSMKYWKRFLPEQQYPNFSEKSSSILYLLFYCEISLMIFALTIEVFKIYESILLALSILFTITLLDIYSLKKVKKNFALFVHTIDYFTISTVILLTINQFVVQYPFLISLEFFIFLSMQFYTNYSLFTSLKLFYPDNENALNKLQRSVQNILGAIFYSTLCFFVLQTLILQNIDILLILLILSSILHVLMIIDNVFLKFLGKATKYLKLVSWMFIMAFSSIYLVWIYATFFIVLFLTVIPLIIIIFIIECAYLFRIWAFWKVVASKKAKIRSYLIILSYLNFVTWPLYFLNLNLLLNLNLVLASFFIVFIITHIDVILKEDVRKLLKSSSFLIFGGLISTDIFLLFLIIPGVKILLNLSISTLVFVMFSIIIVKPFKTHSVKAFIFWVIIFILLSSIIYHVSLSYTFSAIVFSLMILTYPFIFLLEELKDLFNKLLDIISNFYKKIKILIMKILFILSNFIKTHFRGIWIVINIFVSIFFGILFSDAVLGFLNPIHATLLIFPIFGLLYSLIPSKKSENADVRFKRRMIRLIISWGSIIIILFAFITPIWYIFTVWISIWIVGAILLPYMIFKEKREKITIKWRFYTLLILITLLILFGIIFGIQISGTLYS